MSRKQVKGSIVPLSNEVESPLIPGLETVLKFDSITWNGAVPDCLYRDAAGLWYLGRGCEGSVVIADEPTPLGAVRSTDLKPVPMHDALAFYANGKRYSDSFSGDDNILLQAAVEELKSLSTR